MARKGVRSYRALPMPRACSKSNRRCRRAATKPSSTSPPGTASNVCRCQRFRSSMPCTSISAFRIPASTITCRSSARLGVTRVFAAALEREKRGLSLFLSGGVPPRLADPDCPLGAHRGRHCLDRGVVLLHLARQSPGGGQGPGIRRRVVRDPWRRVLPCAEISPRARRTAEHAALVQVGGVLDLAYGFCPAGAGVLPECGPLPDRSADHETFAGGRHRRRSGQPCSWARCI